MLKQVIFVAFLSFVAYAVFSKIIWLGVYQRTFNHSPEKCRKLQTIQHGSEDIQVLPNGLAFISSGVRSKNNEHYNNRKGRIYLFDFNTPDVAAQELAIIADKDFKLVSPHGISLWTDKKTGNVYLYVICHGEQNTDAVDKFRFDADSKTLTHLRHINNDLNVTWMNDLTVVGEDLFYYTKFLYFTDFLEILFGLHWGSVGYFDGHRSTVVDAGLFTPNGVFATPDGRYLYVAQFGVEDIRVYRRENDNNITFQNSIKLGTKLDNIDVDAKTGDLWVGAHPVAYKLFQHIGDPTVISPSQVLRLKMSEGHATKIEEIYSNDGTELPASSVGVVYGKGLLIGSVAESALYCEL